LNDNALIMAAARLSGRAPPEWAEFISAFVSYTDARRDELVGANAENLQAAQGRAQACVALRKLLVECRATAEKIEKNTNQKPHPPR